jgi:5'-nucleotidase
MRARAHNNDRHSVTVAAGDLIGASPLLSAAFHDEPTIEAMNRVGLHISSVGNHEFDEGWRELVRLQRGGCLPDGAGEANQNSCPDHRFTGARFRYLSANVFHADSGRTVLPSVSVKRYGGVRVGFIGMTLENTPNIVTRAGVQGLRFTDEVRTANAVARRLQQRGVKAIVLLLHEGGFPSDPTAYNSCPGISGPVVDIHAGLSPRIDAVITGHTHQAYNCRLVDAFGRPRLVTSGSSLGRLVTDIRLSLGRRTRDVIRSSVVADNRIVTRDVGRNRTINRLVARYKKLVTPIESRVIGHLAGTATLSRAPDASGESPLGNLIADAQRNDPSTVTGGRVPEIAFMNPGGIRADLQTTGGDVTYGSAFSVQPFNNFDVSMDMTGAQVLAALQQQWSGVNADEPRILQVSGITYSYTRSGTSLALVPGSVRVGGEVIDEARTYRVVANSFLSDGGDGFPAFAQATDKYVGGLDIDAFAAYLAANDPYTPAATDRITLVP